MEIKLSPTALFITFTLIIFGGTAMKAWKDRAKNKQSEKPTAKQTAKQTTAAKKKAAAMPTFAAARAASDEPVKRKAGRPAKAKQ